MKVAVIGAGITGVTTTYFLTQKGFKVDLIESRRYPAMATSYANGGQLSASNSEAWNSWHNTLYGIKSIFSNNSSVILNPKPTLSKIIWLMNFISAIKYKNKITQQTCKMAIDSVNLYAQIAKKEKIKFDLYDKGILHFYFNKKQTEHALEVNKLYNQAGLNRVRITHDELYTLEPSLMGRKFDSVFFTKSDKSGDIHSFCNNLVIKLLNENKVKLINKEVTDLRKELKEYDNIFLCAGVGSRKLAKSIGEFLNIYPVKGYSITVNNPGANAPKVSLLDDEKKIVCSRLGEKRLRIAGLAELNGYNLDIIQKRIRPLIFWCNKMFPDINTKDVKPWAGLRPMTPNMLPIFKKSIEKRVWINTGHGHLGWTLSAYTANSVVNSFITE
ncbi:MAG: FAD-dependent oxidoreductase [Alphaproteobacteria bacterium TMED194]|nr:MAG: FAD-dependent oxidoreductase [Alphaproteobacteria bacterium TMED194]|tara:strand:+ start:1564 stop:2721 length:1158 start_codon:yes stop_codon:yes gene_type:complete